MNAEAAVKLRAPRLRSSDLVSRRSLVGGALGALVPTGRSAAAPAGTGGWPDRPLHMVVPYPPGGGTDYVARLLAPLLSATVGQPVVIDNKSGAAGVIGASFVSRAAADGYTILYGENGVMLFNPLVYKRLPYAVADFMPVGMVARVPLVLAANRDAGIDDVRQLIQKARAAPGTLSYATPGFGTPHHMAMEMLMEQAHLAMVQVPYRGATALLQALVSGEVPVAVVPTSVALAPMRAGLVRPLAVLRRARTAWLPDVPTIRDATGFDVDISAWHALFVPIRTPGSIVARLDSALQQALATPDVLAAFDSHGLEPQPLGSAELAAFQRRELATWSALVGKRRLALAE